VSIHASSLPDEASDRISCSTEKHLQALSRAQTTGLGVSGHADKDMDTYGLISIESRAVIESKIRRTGDFFSTVVLSFVLHDLNLLIDKGLKRATAPLID
jgi:hypothetical protein